MSFTGKKQRIKLHTSAFNIDMVFSTEFMLKRTAKFNREARFNKLYTAS